MNLEQMIQKSYHPQQIKKYAEETKRVLLANRRLREYGSPGALSLIRFRADEYTNHYRTMVSYWNRPTLKVSFLTRIARPIIR
jgi:hypothetical protein